MNNYDSVKGLLPSDNGHIQNLKNFKAFKLDCIQKLKVINPRITLHVADKIKTCQAICITIDCRTIQWSIWSSNPHTICTHWKTNAELFRGTTLLSDVKKYFLNLYKKNSPSCNESDSNLIPASTITATFVERLLIEIIVK